MVFIGLKSRRFREVARIFFGKLDVDYYGCQRKFRDFRLPT